MQHLCIVDWNQLPCGTQGYDYLVVMTTVQIAKQNKELQHIHLS